MSNDCILISFFCAKRIKHYLSLRKILFFLQSHRPQFEFEVCTKRINLCEIQGRRRGGGRGGQAPPLPFPKGGKGALLEILLV
jgi:hypothetical protein